MGTMLYYITGEPNYDGWEIVNILDGYGLAIVVMRKLAA